MPQKGSLVQDSFLLAGLLVLAFLISIPCGYLRESFRKYSLMWFVLIHLPIPLVVHMRMIAGFSWRIVPLTLGSAVAGQIVGGWYKRRIRRGGKTTKRTP
jgi:hypothetical protein